MGIQVEFNPDLALRHISEFEAGRRERAECIPADLKAGVVYDFLKEGQRNYWFGGELPLLETKGNAELSSPKASIIMLEATHFNKEGCIYTRGKYQVIEVFTDDQVHFNSYAKVTTVTTTIFNKLRIGVIGSMQFTDKMLALRDELNQLGHDAFVTDLHTPFIGQNETVIERLKIDQKMSQDVIKDFWEAMQGADAVLVANFDKNGISNYIGGNTLLEIGFAHVLNQKIFLLNTIPDIHYYKSEIEAMRPVIINGDLSKIG